jgi:hypothetical protein
MQIECCLDAEKFEVVGEPLFRPRAAHRKKMRQKFPIEMATYAIRGALNTAPFAAVEIVSV